jgi:hypothetical protein
MILPANIAIIIEFTFITAKMPSIIKGKNLASLFSNLFCDSFLPVATSLLDRIDA